MEDVEVTWLVEQRFIYKARDERSVEFIARLSNPQVWETDESRHTAYRCRVGMHPLGEDRWVTSISGFTALCSALDHIRTVLRFLVADGGRVYWENSEDLVDLDSPWFGPMPGPKELRLDVASCLQPSQA